MIAVGSVRSGGATTLALTLAACMERAVLVEADADGGVLALRYGLSREPGLLSLAATRQPAGGAVLEHAQRLPGGLAVVVAPESPEQSTRLLRSAGSRLAALLGGIGDPPIVVDAGRLSPSSPALRILEVASAVLVVARPRADELVAGAERVASMGERAALVLVGSGPYSANDVATQLGCPVIGSVADDARAARTLAQGGSASALTRSALVRSVRTLAAALAGSTGGSGAPESVTHEWSGVPA